MSTPLVMTGFGRATSGVDDAGGGRSRAISTFTLIWSMVALWPSKTTFRAEANVLRGDNDVCVGNVRERSSTRTVA